MKLRAVQHGVQQQVLAQALQQSLQLLQMPILELKALLEQELESNPVLEELPGPGESMLDGTLPGGAVDHLARMTHQVDGSSHTWGSGDDEEDAVAPLSVIAQPPPSLED